MIDRGARNLVLTSRRGANEKCWDLATRMSAYKATIAVHQCDVASEDDVRKLINTISQEMPPIKGIIHSAMVLHVSRSSNLKRDY